MDLVQAIYERHSVRAYAERPIEAQASSALSVEKREKLTPVIALGYGKAQGKGHKVKDSSEVASSNASGGIPDWFASGVAAALLAPTAINQQKFHFTLTDDGVIAKKGRGFYTACDLGIAKYHFEIGAHPHPVTLTFTVEEAVLPVLNRENRLFRPYISCSVTGPPSGLSSPS